jgi:predicted nucleotidyltransferase
MDVSRPYTAVCPSLDGEVLQTLAGTTMALTGRQVALLTGRSSHSGALKVLNRLAEHGLVDRVELNRASLFSLNREHLAAPAVEMLFGLRSELLDRIRKLTKTWPTAPVHLSLFGSTARGDGDTDSDIDLFVVRPAAILEENVRWRDQLDALDQKIGRWTGNRAAILEASETELARLAEEEPPIVSELRADAIVLSGLDVASMFGDR